MDGVNDGLGRSAGKVRPECKEADGNHTHAELEHTPEEQEGHDANVVSGAQRDTHPNRDLHKTPAIEWRH